MPAESPFRIVRTVCSHDCPDSCAVLVTVNAEGRAVKVAGDPRHPITQGFLCAKVAKYLTLDRLKNEGYLPLAFHSKPDAEPFLPFTSGNVPTPSGKIEFFSAALEAAGIDPLPGFQPPRESRWGEAASRYPLELLARKSDNYLNSTFQNLPGHRAFEKVSNQRLEMHPADAASRGIAEGERVRISNDRGSLDLELSVNPHLPAGVVAERLDWAKLHPGGGNVNALTSERLTDIGRGATFYSTLVQVTRAL